MEALTSLVLSLPCHSGELLRSSNDLTFTDVIKILKHEFWDHSKPRGRYRARGGPKKYTIASEVFAAMTEIGRTVAGEPPLTPQSLTLPIGIEPISVAE